MSERQPDNERIALLARKWKEGIITEAEKQEFEAWFHSFDDTDDMEDDPALQERMYRSIVEKERIGRPAKVFRLRHVAAAAAVAGVMLLAGWWFNRQHMDTLPAIAKVDNGNTAISIIPGSNKAMLILASGAQVVLDSAKNGLLAKQDVTNIVKEADGSIIYEKPGAGAGLAGPLYNTLTTPRGGQYAITLPDGSKVWLNAASSIRFPTRFAGGSRKVEVQGEAYFEIAANAAMPFVVAVNYPDGKVMDVEVLGTMFNIMAYPDEKVVKTTLVAGAVRVSGGQQSQVLRPGQQAQLQQGILQTLNNADTETAIAWKNGQTLFANEDITAIMRKISRWYDVDIEYRGTITNRKFTGGISRQSDISAILKILELNHIHSIIEGKKVILMP